jgi:hypothetical protein
VGAKGTGLLPVFIPRRPFFKRRGPAISRFACFGHAGRLPRVEYEHMFAQKGYVRLRREKLPQGREVCPVLKMSRL